jgi:SAM-dependent methyltransferase
LKPLTENDDSEFRTADGEVYPSIDGVTCLLREDERGTDLGDRQFYDSNPFGTRDWTDKEDVDAGVEDDLKRLLNVYDKDSLIIDVGSGPGRISNYLSLHGYKNIVSLDYSLPSLKQVRENSKNICIWGNNLHLPFASESFDLVISSGVIHHTPDPVKAFDECARIVNKGGRFYVRLYNLHSLYGYLYYTYGAVLRGLNSFAATRWLSDLLGFRVYGLVRKLFFDLPDRDEAALKAKFGNLFTKDMVYFFTTGEIRELMRKNGLAVETAQTLGKTHRMHFYVARKQP